MKRKKSEKKIGKIGLPDRVTMSLGRKISITRFENLDLFVSYSMDKEPKESSSKAITRLEQIVIPEFERLVGLVEGGSIKGAQKEVAA